LFMDYSCEETYLFLMFYLCKQNPWSQMLSEVVVQRRVQRSVMLGTEIHDSNLL
jgi:hypothetical protein